MKKSQETAAQEDRLDAATDREVPYSSSDGQPQPGGQGIKKTAFERLLETDKAFYRKESARLAALARRLKVPRSEIPDVVNEAWARAAVKHRKLFADATDADIKPRLHGFLRKTVYGLAVDLQRHFHCCHFQSLDAEAIELFDDAEARHAETAEVLEWLDALLAKVSPGNEENVLLLRMHYFQGYSIRELAQLFGKTDKSVDNRIRRVRKELRRLVNESLRSISERSEGVILRLVERFLGKKGKKRGEIGRLIRLLL